MPTFHAPLDRLAFSLSRCPKIRDRRTPPSVLASSPPPKRGDGSRHYLPLSSEARADQGCRKRRNQVPDWSEITCRVPPKSPAAFDRNQVPVCSDFCTSMRLSWFESQISSVFIIFSRTSSEV